MIEEIRALGKKAVLIYFGGVMDRIEQIASLGADSLNVETSMKSYVNDLAEIAAQVGDRVCLWGNIDPVSVVQNGTDEDLRRAIAEQVAIGRRAGKFIVSTGSPITPLTPLPRIRCFIDLGRELGTLTP
jgi:uroporphyrinogen decarboxylase